MIARVGKTVRPRSPTALQLHTILQLPPHNTTRHDKSPTACGKRPHSQCKLPRPSPPYALLIRLVLRDMKIEMAKPMPARKGVTASITSVMSHPRVKAAQQREQT